MDTRPIGIFDSGLGGLTALAELKKALPEEHFVYLGDTLRVPYGDKSREELLKCAEDNIKFMLRQNVKAILIACGTVSSTLSAEDFKKIPVVTEGVVIPSVKKALDITNGKIGIIATAASIKAGAYKKALLERRGDLEIYDVACPEFVVLVEADKTSIEIPEVREAIEKYILPLKKAGIDTLILGCTHYPLLEDAIRSVLGDVNFINVGKCAAEEIISKIEKGNLSACEYFVTSDCEGFKEKAGKFLKEGIENIKEISL